MHICVVYNLGHLTIFSNNLTDIVQKHPADKFLVFAYFNLPYITWEPDDDGLTVCSSKIQRHIQFSLLIIL